MTYHEDPDTPDTASDGVGDVRQRPTLRTRSVHAGEQPGEIRSLGIPIFQHTAFAYADAAIAGDSAASGKPMYARDGMPNVRALEQAVADLEGTEDAHATASGMAALSLTLLTLLSSGDHVVLNAGCYEDTVSLLHEHLTRFGIAVSTARANDPEAIREAMTPATRLVMIETISNPSMALTDIPAIADVVRPTPALLCVDNTFASPALCRPLEHGADLVIHSAGKFLGGHHDATGGVIAGSTAVIDQIRRAGFLFGPLLSPFDAWLLLRGIKTLAPRMSWMSVTASRIASALDGHPAIRAVRYPGLPGGVAGGLVHRLLPRGTGPLLAFDLAGGTDAAIAFTRYLRTIPYVGSVGGSETIISFPPQPTPRLAPATPRDYRCATLRMSVGLEDPDDLIADITQALDRLSAAPVASSRGMVSANGRHPEAGQGKR